MHGSRDRARETMFRSRGFRTHSPTGLVDLLGLGRGTPTAASAGRIRSQYSMHSNSSSHSFPTGNMRWSLVPGDSRNAYVAGRRKTVSLSTESNITFESVGIIVGQTFDGLIIEGVVMHGRYRERLSTIISILFTYRSRLCQAHLRFLRTSTS